jgi:TonB family protein
MPLEAQPVRRAKRLSRPPERFPPVETMRAAAESPRRSLARALLGGAILSFLLFCLLAWIQPVFNKNERIELPTAVKLTLEGMQAERPRQAAARRKTEIREEARPEPKARPKSAAPRRAAAQDVPQARAQTQQLTSMKNVSMFSAIGAASGSGSTTLKISFDSADQEVARKAEDFQRWQDRRSRIRDQFQSGRSGRDGDELGAREGPGRVEIKIRSADDAYLPPPRYPQKALNEQVEGFVKVRMLISVTGTIEKFEIVAAQPPGYFEEAIKEALPRWRFSPAVDESGRPIEFEEVYTYQFRLQDAAL